MIETLTLWAAAQFAEIMIGSAILGAIGGAIWLFDTITDRSNT